MNSNLFVGTNQLKVVDKLWFSFTTPNHYFPYISANENIDYRLFYYDISLIDEALFYVT